MAAAFVSTTMTAPQSFVVTQIDATEVHSKNSFAVGSSFPFSFNLGPLTISGSIDPSSMSMTASVSVLGISLGTFSGNLKTGITISINLIAASGSITLYLKNGNELWIKGHISVVFDGSWDFDQKIVTIPI